MSLSYQHPQHLRDRNSWLGKGMQARHQLCSLHWWNINQIPCNQAPRPLSPTILSLAHSPQATSVPCWPLHMLSSSRLCTCGSFCLELFVQLSASSPTSFGPLFRCHLLNLAFSSPSQTPTPTRAPHFSPWLSSPLQQLSPPNRKWFYSCLLFLFSLLNVSSNRARIFVFFLIHCCISIAQNASLIKYLLNKQMNICFILMPSPLSLSSLEYISNVYIFPLYFIYTISSALGQL